MSEYIFTSHPVNSSSDTHLFSNGIPFTRMTIPSRDEMDKIKNSLHSISQQ
jgi:hypothetical protein